MWSHTGGKTEGLVKLSKVSIDIAMTNLSPNTLSVFIDLRLYSFNFHPSSRVRLTVELESVLGSIGHKAGVQKQISI